MKPSKYILLVLCLVAWSFAGLLSRAHGRKPQTGTATIAGTVLDAGSMAALPGVEVAWRSKKVMSDQTGHYEIELPVGVREITFSASKRIAIKKLLIIREPGSKVREDVLLPNSSGMPAKVLALDRGSRVGLRGADLDSDLPADSTISLADEYGNYDELLTLGKNRAHSPIWLNASTIAFAKEGFLHNPENSKLLGVFQFQNGSTGIQPIAPGTDARFLSKSPAKDALAVASQKDLYVMDSLSNPASLRRIFSLPANQGFLLSVDWAQDDRIYFTVDDSIPLDNRHYLTKSRIASIKADGTDFKPDWASDHQYSYRYPMNAPGGEIIYCRFALDGQQQALWSRDTRTGATKTLAEPALRAVHLDPNAGRLYYIYGQDLHLRNLKTSADWVIVNSVKEADYFHSR